MPLQTLVVFLLGAAAAGGLLWVFLYPLLSGERQAEKRQASVARPERASRAASARGATKSRREQVEESLKELELRKKRSRNPALPLRLAQAGLSWSPRQFYLISATLGLCVIGGALLVGGVKAGLPLGDCLKIIANEAQEPVKSEFRSIVETQAIGMPVGEACLKLYESVPLPEPNFFGIVVSIQQKSGGNLSEALGNLSRVLRDRKRMQAKIRAMSMEAKASAAIIGALPPVVMLLVYITSPNYIELLWTAPVGRMMLVVSAMWMMTGVFVMKKMINFDF